jgi:anti-sigma factor RsiW
MPTDELTCQELVEIVTDYLEGAMPTDERLRFEEHLVVCPGCEAYVAQMRETIRLAGALREEDIAPAARDRLLETFRDWKRIRDARV